MEYENKYEPSFTAESLDPKKLPEVRLSMHNGTVRRLKGKINSSKQAADMFRQTFEHGELALQEQFVVLYLNNANEVMDYYKHSKGGISGVMVDVRLVLAAALKRGCTQMIVAHNHPSGKLQPSRNDEIVTEKLKQAGKIIDIKLLDHLVLTSDSFFSFADENLMGLEGLQNTSQGNEITKPNNTRGSKITEPKQPAKQGKSTPAKKRSPKSKRKSSHVDSFKDEILVIRRMLNMNGKKKTKRQILLFINYIQRKIVEKRIRKTSPYASQVKFIQEWLVALYNKMGKSAEVKINDKRRLEFQRIIDSKHIRPSVKLVKRYINLHGKPAEYKQIKSLHNAIANAINVGKVNRSDPHYNRLLKIIESLRAFNCKVGHKGHLQIHHATLKGLHGVLDGVENDKDLGEVHPVTKNTIMNSRDIQKLKFNRIGFHGKWRQLIGDPSPGFSVMIFGRPKLGKSYMAVDFAGYLAEYHGKVLYVAKEEGIDATVQEKIEQMDAANDNLDFGDFLPNDLSDYDFIFLDSVNKLNLTPEDLDELRTRHPKTSFVFIFQTTKSGNFRGRNDFQHDVDVVIEVPELGLALQNGRFNQGSEMKIF